MRYQRLDLNLLIALKALLAERNVTRAAQTMHITQSAMSGVLARLREYFGDPLIVPMGRRMELSPLAESLVAPVNDLLLRIDATLGTRPEFDPKTTPAALLARRLRLRGERADGRRAEAAAPRSAGPRDRDAPAEQGVGRAARSRRDRPG